MSLFAFADDTPGNMVDASKAPTITSNIIKSNIASGLSTHLVSSKDQAPHPSI